MSWKYKIQESFEKNSKILFENLKGDEEVSLSLDAEESDFVRFNKGKVRQTTSVEQAQASMLVQTKTKLAKMSFPLTGNLDEDRKRCLFYVGKARNEMTMLPDNPYPVMFAESGTSQTDEKAQTPTSEFIIDKVQKTVTAQDDFVGYMASGPLIKAIANSRGTSHWHSSDIFFVDYSLYSGKVGNAKAVTDNVAGSNWNEQAWQTSLNQSRTFLHQMQKPARDIPRGEYNVYLAPSAVEELKNITSWGGFSQASYKQGQCGLKLLADGERKLSEKLTILENFDLGVEPRFNSLGEMSAQQISIIENGVLQNLMTSSKTAAEFKLKSNGAETREVPRTMEIKPGSIKRDQIFQKLNTGLYLSNLHYVNWSDQKTARLTGMTRFACFWVENGDIVSPIQDMRFDVSIYDIWGKDLIDLTDFQAVSVNNLTYGCREFGGSKLPGMLIQNFKFTL